MKKIILLFIILLIPIKVSAFQTSASSAVLMDTDSNRIIYSKNPHKIQSVASISKIMTAIIAIENSNIKTKVTVGDEILKAYGSGIYIKHGETLTIEDLIYGLLLRSGNDAAASIAVNISKTEEEFVKKMNQKAKELKMSDTTFNNPSGLDEKKGNYSSAYDMALLMSYCMQNEDFRNITSTKTYTLKTNKNVYKWKNKNKLLRQYKYTTGGKTGFTKIAKRTLVTTASKDNLNLTVVTLNDGNDWLDHKNLYEEAFKKYTSYEIIKKGNTSILGETYYKKNTLYTKKEFKYPLLKSETESLLLKYKLKKNPNYKNKDKIGKVEVYLGDKKIHTQNIYVSTKIKKQSFINKLLNKEQNDK